MIKVGLLLKVLLSYDPSRPSVCWLVGRLVCSWFVGWLVCHYFLKKIQWSEGKNNSLDASELEYKNYKSWIIIESLTFL